MVDHNVKVVDHKVKLSDLHLVLSFQIKNRKVDHKIEPDLLLLLGVV